MHQHSNYNVLILILIKTACNATEVTTHTLVKTTMHLSEI